MPFERDRGGLRMVRAVVAMGLVTCSGPVCAATWSVDPSAGSDAVGRAPGVPFSTIQAAIDAAADGDEVLVPGGFHRGPGNRELTFHGKNIRLTCATWPDQLIPCVLDAEGSARVFIFDNGESPDAVVEGLIIARGSAVADPRLPSDEADRQSRESGGCVLIRESSPTFVNCAFVGCTGGTGGAVAAFGGGPEFRRCAFALNTSTSSGGAAYLEGSHATIRSSDLAFNGAIDAAVIIVGGRTTIRECSFVGNWALGTSGVRNVGGRPRLINCEFLSGLGSLEAVQNDQADALIANSLFARNIGGGLRNSGGGPRIVNCTVTENDGPGIVNDGTGTAITNTIVFGNGGDALVGDVDSATYSLIEGGAPGTGNINLDPLFEAPRLGNFQLGPGSPAIDAGDNDAVPLPARLRDLARRRRFRDDPDTTDTGLGDPPIVDIGAYEFAPRLLGREGTSRSSVSDPDARRSPKGEHSRTTDEVEASIERMVHRYEAILRELETPGERLTSMP
jgi:hypothetical protein